MDKTTIARALGMLTDVRQTMVSVSDGTNPWVHGECPWIDAFDQAYKLIKNELTVEEAHTFKRRM